MIHTSAEFRRVAALPRRDPSVLMTDAHRDAVTSVLRLPGGACPGGVVRETPRGPLCSVCGCPLRATGEQAAALIELAMVRGLLGAMGVGSGKTLVTFCAATVLEAKRPVLCVPGGLVGKTERDFAVLRRHWRETPLTIVSYEKLGRAQWSQLLSELKPDLVIDDECHALRNRDGAACARVVEAYYDGAEHKPVVVNLSGTVTGGSVLDYAHLAKWSLGPAGTFLPVDWYELDLLRRAVDAEVEAGARVSPGVWLELPHDAPKGATKLQRARDAVRRRMIETPGVIRTTTSGVDAGLRISAIDVPDGVGESVWSDLRGPWVLPNGEECLDGLEVHRHARELACGYYSVWDPPPPADWYQARKTWGKCVRKGIKARWCNTEVEARTACESWGTQRFQVKRDDLVIIERVDPVAARDAWFAIRDTFRPNPVPVWLSTATLETCAQWARKVKSGIIWTQHVPFGERLEADHGIPYYREKGFDRRGRYIEDGSGVICASVSANGTGRNLQHQWSRNLLVSPFGSGERNEQMLGRTHRPGTTADVVEADALIVCREHVSALQRARVRAAAIEQLTDTPQKLCYADFLIDLEGYKGRDGSRWISAVADEDDAFDDAEIDGAA